MKTTTGILWSAGWDSTALLMRHLIEKKEPIQPIYIAHRGGGKCCLEWKILTEQLYPALKKKYPHGQLLCQYL